MDDFKIESGKTAHFNGYDFVMNESPENLLMKVDHMSRLIMESGDFEFKEDDEAYEVFFKGESLNAVNCPLTEEDIDYIIFMISSWEKMKDD